LGIYASAVEAALAYNRAAPEAFGEFGRPNTIIDERRLRELLRERDELQLQLEGINQTLKEWPCE